MELGTPKSAQPLYYSPKGPFLSEALDSIHSVRFSKFRTSEVTYELQRKEVLPLLSDRLELLISNSPSRGSNPPASARHSCVRPGFPRDARFDRKSGLFAHSILSPDPRFADLKAEIGESFWSANIPVLRRLSAEISLTTTTVRGQQSISRTSQPAQFHRSLHPKFWGACP